MKTRSEAGVALILSLLIVSFLAILGGALLSSMTIDLWIGANYKTRIQALHLAESGIEEARERLRVSGPSDILPFVSGNGVGSYQVLLRSTGAPDVFLLTSVAQVANSKKTIEAMVRKGSFPAEPLDPRLSTVKGLKRLMEAVSNNAMDVYPTGSVIENYGSPAEYRVAVVNGDAILRSVNGYGLLLVKGELRLSGALSWNGVIIVLGQGVVTRDADVAGQVRGGLFTARLYDNDGRLLATPVNANFDITDRDEIVRANASFPYSFVSVREN